MEYKEGKITGLYIITGLLIGLTLWFSYDRIEKSVQKKKAEKYFAGLRHDIGNLSTSTKSISIGTDSFDLMNSAGEPVTIYPGSGQMIFINMWASWSISCIENLPALARLYNKTRGKIDFYLVTGEHPDKVRRIMKNQDLDLPCYYFKQMHELPACLRQTDLPYSCIMHDGKILFEYTGVAPWDSENFIDFVDGLVKEDKTISELITLQRIDVLNIINFN
jgi:hypothetical protein